MSTRATNSENEEIATKADVDDRRKDEESEYTSEAKTEEIECAVCLQPCVHPVRLPCLHVFCFLCVKGVVSQSKRCAMCRQEIPSDYLDHPHLLNKLEEKDTECEGYQWFYEGRNGWWQYDERTSVELEAAYNSGNRVCEVLVAGFLYMVDFDGMVQQRRNDPSRRRRIKRDLASIPKKGIAGIKTALSEDPVEPRPTEVVSQSSDLQDLHLLHSEIYRNLNASRSGVIQSTDLTASSRTDNEDFTSNDSLNSTEDVTVDNVTNHLSDLTVASEDYSSYTEEYQLPNGDEL